ncbi:MAG TPA: cupredoxin domain-containing protein [Candidatus Baltobacteraceae bacterium]|nr:cupredoxin domain-containing protein [Candidatus Baltobacteraceae bacterium]
MLFALLTACTPGGVAPSTGGSASTATIDINLTLDPGGYAPDTITIPVGSTIRFRNSDGFAHTASVLKGLSTFPASSPLTAAAQTQSGTAISQTWSTGNLAAGAVSQTILIDQPGTYLYACFYHYGAPMHGTIVAQ